VAGSAAHKYESSNLMCGCGAVHNYEQSITLQYITTAQKNIEEAITYINFLMILFNYFE
jgi:hypothetical protein